MRRSESELESAFHRRRSGIGRPFGRSRRAAAAGRRGQLPHVLIDVRKHRPDPRSVPLFAGDFRPRALLRLLQVDVSTSTTGDRSNTPYRWVAGGATALFGQGTDESVPGRATAGDTQGQGPRRHRLSTLPTAIARDGDFAPTPIAPGALLSRAAPSALFGETRGESGSPTRRTLARRAQRQGRATADSREEIRRSPTRGAFRRRAVRGRTDVPPAASG